MSENTSQEYWADIRSMVESALSDCGVTNQEEFEDNRDAVYDNLRESVDGSSWIIYNARNLDVIRFTDNEDAYQDIGLEGCADFSEICCRVAFCAMERDAYDAVDGIVEELPECGPEEIEEEEEDTTDQPAQVQGSNVQLAAQVIYSAFEDPTTGIFDKARAILSQLKPTNWSDADLQNVIGALTEFRNGKSGLEQTAKEIVELIA